MRRWLLPVLLGLLLSGCVAPGSSANFAQRQSPACEYQGRPGTPTVLLAAQAVPTASLLPCVRLLPSGWSLGGVFVRSGLARFTLNSDRVGTEAVRVLLTQTCQIDGATRVPSDEPGARRFQRVGDVRTGVGFTGEQFYLFPGGCVAYEFRFSGEERAAPITEVTLALGFVTRDALRTSVRQDSQGHAELDPPSRGR